MINQWLETLGEAIRHHVWLAPALALLAGFLTSFTPCSLSTIPLVIGYVGGYAGGDTKKAFRYSLVFSAGMAVTFTVLGILAAVFGRLLRGTGSWWYLVLGVLMILMALQVWEVFQFIPSTYATGKNSKKGYLGALLTGLLGGLFASPCSTPVLVVLLAMAAEQGNLLMGAFLLLLYAVGHSTVILIAGASVGFVSHLAKSDKYQKYNQISKIVMGGLIMALGLYMLYMGF